MGECRKGSRDLHNDRDKTENRTGERVNTYARRYPCYSGAEWEVWMQGGEGEGRGTLRQRLWTMNLRGEGETLDSNRQASNHPISYSLSALPAARALNGKCQRYESDHITLVTVSRPSLSAPASGSPRPPRRPTPRLCHFVFPQPRRALPSERTRIRQPCTRGTPGLLTGTWRSPMGSGVLGHSHARFVIREGER